MKLQRIYYYNNLIPIILQSIIMKKYETIIYYNENNFGQVTYIHNSQTILLAGPSSFVTLY